jgi:hypothetical protein
MPRFEISGRSIKIISQTQRHVSPGFVSVHKKLRGGTGHYLIITGSQYYMQGNGDHNNPLRSNMFGVGGEVKTSPRRWLFEPKCKNQLCNSR